MLPRRLPWCAGPAQSVHVVEACRARDHKDRRYALVLSITSHELMCRNLAMENGPLGVRVNAICPSWVDTDIMQQPFNKAPAFRELIDRVVPLGRMAQPEEVGGLCVALCSPISSYVNGASLMIDGGLTLTVYPRS